MSGAGDRLAQAAEALVGTRFRLHGRDPATGLDCIGLVGNALAACGQRVRYPRGYALRNADIAGWIGFAAGNGLVAVGGTVMRGDILLVRPGAAQHHLLAALGPARFVHAHAGLRRVVVQDLILQDQPLVHWRLAEEDHPIWQR